MKPLRSLAALAMAAGLVCASGAAAAATAPAAAAAPTAASASIHASAGNAVAPLHANEVATTCPQQSGHVRTYYNGCVNWTSYVCVALHHFNISPPNYVSNDCEQTVQLWTGGGETGHAICIPGHHASGFLHTKYHSFDITGSGAC